MKSATQVASWRRRREAWLRLFDLLVIACLAPLLVVAALAIAIAVALDSPGPVLYRARRIGRDGVPFDMLKFRKMREDAAGPLLTAPFDERFTPIGKFLALTRLDELPQVYNVLRGEMRLVGPRPEVAEFVSLHTREYATILTVRPGITGLAQLTYAGEHRLLADCEDPAVLYQQHVLPNKVALDCAYVATRGLLLDLRILALTPLLPARAAKFAVYAMLRRHTRTTTVAAMSSTVAAMVMLAAFIQTQT